MKASSGGNGETDSASPVQGHALESRCAALSEAVARLRGWRRALAGITAGAASVLAMPPFFAWPVLLVTLPLLLWLMEESVPAARGEDAAARSRHARGLGRPASAGWLFGFGFHVAGLYWLREAFLITGGGLGDLWPLGVIGLPAALAIFHAAATAAAFAVSRPGLERALALAVTFGIAEWLRGNILTGFPWNVLGIALTGPSPLMQATGLFGIYGLTSLTAIALAGPLAILARADTRDPRRHRALAVSLPLVPLVALYVYGSYRLSIPPPPALDGVRMRLVQPSIPQRDKWRADRQPAILARHIDLSLRDATGTKDDLAGISHVVWPEAAMPFLPLQRPQVLSALADMLPTGVTLLSGIVRIERRPGAPDPTDYDAYNSLAVFDDAGRPAVIYDKTHLVPFGEYLPFQRVLEAIGLQTLTRQRGGFASGPEPRPTLTAGPLSGIAPLICYEGIFPGVGRRSASRPTVYVNITNDGWFGNSTGPRQHHHQARLRSIEEGVSLIRVANNGITAVFDPFGRELARIELDMPGVIDTSVPSPTAPSLYGRLGDLMFCGVICILLFAFLNTRQR